jgi:hypothetical protein
MLVRYRWDLGLEGLNCTCKCEISPVWMMDFGIISWGGGSIWSRYSEHLYNNTNAFTVLLITLWRGFFIEVAKAAAKV